MVLYFVGFPSSLQADAACTASILKSAEVRTHFMKQPNALKPLQVLCGRTDTLANIATLPFHKPPKVAADTSPW